MFTYKGIDIGWLGHDGFMIEKKPLRIYIDPFKLGDGMGKPADLVLITHSHYDHCSIEDLRKIVVKKTKIVAPSECMSSLRHLGECEIVPIRLGQAKHVLGLTITPVAAYNTNKYKDPATKTVYHPKEDGKLGYIIDIEGVKIYHAGDTDETREMSAVHCEIALLPVSGTYVMTAEEAASVAKKIKPTIAIPMHYGEIVGTRADAIEFKELLEDAEIEVMILEKEL